MLYEYLLEYSKEEAAGLQKFADEITRLTEQKQLDEADKAQSFTVMKKIIQRGDTTSYACQFLSRYNEATVFNLFSESIFYNIHKTIYQNAYSMVQNCTPIY